MPEKISSTIAWRRRLGFWDDVRWTRRHIKMSPTSLVSSTRLSLPTTMSMTLTTNTHVLNDVRHVESIKIFDIDPIITGYDILVDENFNQSDTS